VLAQRVSLLLLTHHCLLFWFIFLAESCWI